MSIEGLGKKFQEARVARGLTLDEAARMTKIRPSRLAEIEADDFSQFPSLAYAKGFLLIYGKFLDVDVSPYLDAFETSSQVTVDGYSYLQEEPAPKLRRERAPMIRRPKPSRSSPWPLVLALAAIVLGFLLMRLFLNIQRLAPRTEQRVGVAEASPEQSPPIPRPSIVQRTPVVETVAKKPEAPPTVAPSAAPVATSPPEIASSSPVASVAPSPKEPEIRRAQPVGPEDLAKAGLSEDATESGGPNRVAIKPLRKTYIKVVVDNEATKPAFERWISPSDGIVEFRGQHIAVRVLDRDAIQIKKNGKLIADGDIDVTVE
jgi:cytoskeleton protein RodZ